MIINSIADAQVTDNKLIEFKFREIAYSVTGSNGSTLSGTVNAGEYREIDAKSTGSAPYKVSLGYVNKSVQAQPVSVDSDDAMVTFYMAFPSGPNGPKSFVFLRQK